MMENIKDDEQFEFVNKIYKQLFNEELPKNCKTCGGNFYRKLKYAYERFSGNTKK